MPASVARSLRVMLTALALACALLAPRGDAQALPLRHTVAVTRFQFERMGANAGLQQGGISMLYQDAAGFLWISTPSGLYRYDGRRLLAFPQAVAGPGGSGAVVADMSPAGVGRFWLSTYGNNSRPAGPDLILFDLDKGQLPLPAGLRAPGSGARLLSLGVQALLMSGPQGVTLWDGQRLHTLWHAPAAAEGAQALVACGAQQAYALANGTLLQVRWPTAAPGRAQAQPLTVPAPAGSGRTLLCAADGRLLLGTQDGLYARNGTQWQRLWPAAGTASVDAIAEDGHGALWIGPGNGGLLRLATDGQVQILPAAHGREGALPPGRVRQLLVTRDGTLWGIVGAAGIVYTDTRGTRFESVVVPDASDPRDGANFIRALAPAADDAVWVGSHAGLMRYQPHDGQLTDYSALLQSALDSAPPPHVPGDPHLAPGQIAIEGIAAQPDGVLWLASDLGLLRFDPASSTVARAYTHDPGNPLPGQWLFTVWRAPDGTLWLAGANRGAAYWRPGMEAPHWLAWLRADEPFPHVFAFAAAGDGGVWMAANGGLLLWRDGQLTRYQHQPGQPHSLAGDGVISLYRDHSGTLWVGTTEGLDALPATYDAANPQFRHYGVRQGLPDDVIYCMTEQPAGRLWIGTNLGIAALDTRNGDIHRYGRQHGIRGLESNAGTCTALADGRIAFGGPQGFVVGLSNGIGAGSAQLPLRLSSLRIGDGAETAVPADGTLRIAAGQTLRIGFGVADFLDRQGTLYRYRLLGHDGHWTAPRSTHGAAWDDLPGGRYRFEVVRSNAAGALLGAPAILRVIVVPPWWNRPAMHALYAFLAGGLLLALIGLTWSRRRSERAFRRESAAREARLRLALWGSGDSLWELDLQRGVLERMGNGTQSETPHETRMSLEDWRRYAVHPDDLAQVESALADHLEGRTPAYESEHRLRVGPDQWRWVRARGKVSESDAVGSPLRVIGTARDIGDELVRERERSIAEMVVRSMGEAVAVNDAQLRFVAVNPAFVRMTGYGAAEVLGQPASLLDSPDQPESGAEVRAQLAISGHYRGELWQRKRDGEPFLCRVEINAIADGHGLPTHYVAVLSDVTATRRAEQELHYLANYDPLTGLPNRALLTARLGEAILRARQMGRLVAVLFVDLDRFKHINDAHGHGVGDRVLQATARRLRSVVRDDDTVARLGGDEFTVVLERVAQMGDAEDVAQKLIAAFAEPMELGDGREAHISPSIGIALFPDHGQAPTDLLKYADIAMYRAKESGRNTWMVYTEALDAEVRQRADLIAALQHAIKRDELHLVYQPKLDLDAGRITGVEALLRWRSSEFGDIPPSLFIPLAEEIGLIGAIGEFVLERACGELARWRAADLTEVSMAVNLSVAQLGHSDLVQHLQDTLQRHDLPPERLELEITESMLMVDPERARAILERINGLGVSIAIDDFGTGYSSLAYLQRLPLDTLKIDQTFVAKLTFSPDDETILGTIVLMAHALGLNVVAEGVETAEQMDYLREKDCDEVQGYAVSRPLPGPACLAFIRDHARGRGEAAL